jgi:hypothetical protein
MAVVVGPRPVADDNFALRGNFSGVLRGSTRLTLVTQGSVVKVRTVIAGVTDIRIRNGAVRPPPQGISHSVTYELSRLVPVSSCRKSQAKIRDHEIPRIFFVLLASLQSFTSVRLRIEKINDCSVMSGNGSSYQKDGGPSYQPVPTSNQEVVHEGKSSWGKKVTIWSLAVIVLAGVVYEFVHRTEGVAIPTNVLQPNSSKSSTVSSASSATGVTTSKNGKLKLFDDQSKKM